MGFAKDKKEMLAIGRIVNEEMIRIFDLLRFLIDELLSSKVGCSRFTFSIATLYRFIVVAQCVKVPRQPVYTS